MNAENDSGKNRARQWGGKFFTARFFLMRAGAIGVLFLLAHLLGLREYTTFLSGTTGSPGVSLQLSACYGLVYLALYMGCMVLAPILVLAAGLLAVLERRGTPQRK